MGNCICSPCSFCKRVLTSLPNEYKVIKQLLGFPFGISLGIGFHYLVVENLKLEDSSKYLLSGIICLSLGFGYALSVQVRCMAILLVPVLFTKAGRSVISAVIIGMLIAVNNDGLRVSCPHLATYTEYAIIQNKQGPIGNIVYNARESIRSLTCTVSMGYNLTKQIMELKYKPIANVLSDIMVQAPNLKDISKEIKKNFSILNKEVEDNKEIEESRNRTNEVDGKLEGWGRAAIIEKKFTEKRTKIATKVDHKGSFVESFYAKKQAFRCQDIFNFAADRCQTVFKDMEKKCFKKIGILGVTSVICLAFRVLMPTTSKNESCESSDDAVNPGFGEGFVEAEKAAQDFDKNFDVDMKYQMALSPAVLYSTSLQNAFYWINRSHEISRKLVSEEEPLDLKTAEDVSAQIEYEFKIRQMWFEIIATLLQRIMALLILIIIKGAFDYTNGYLSDFRFDNNYVTSYFKKIDERRYLAGKSNLDIRKSRKALKYADLVYPWSPHISQSEKKGVFSASIKIFLDIVTAVILILFDRLFYEILSIVKEHSTMTVTQKGAHKILFQVYGNSILAHIFRKLFKGIKSDHTLDSYTSNLECLPTARKLETRFIIRIILMNVFALIMLYVQAYALRTRRIICSFFYPKREKKRTIFLYNDLISKKKTKFEFMKEKVLLNAKIKKLQQKSGMLVALRNQFPRCLFWLKYLKSGKRSCLLCDDLERGTKEDFVKCPSRKGCPFVYCSECWKDLKETCYGCISQEKLRVLEYDFKFAQEENDEE
ncbi:protein sneaky-like [Gordionus sp. m RMFG-2023]|uniref:protein sneaky-like n=1 Tax=Gordionus sp. m RMFG-2023 TaxID=3053472 RepID=UPI0031FD1DEC